MEDSERYDFPYGRGHLITANKEDKLRSHIYESGEWFRKHELGRMSIAFDRCDFSGAEIYVSSLNYRIDSCARASTFAPTITYEDLLRVLSGKRCAWRPCGFELFESKIHLYYLRFEKTKAVDGLCISLGHLQRTGIRIIIDRGEPSGRTNYWVATTIPAPGSLPGIVLSEFQYGESAYMQYYYHTDEDGNTWCRAFEMDWGKPFTD